MVSGNNNNVNQHQPRRVGGLIHNRFIKAVACGQNCTMAVTTSGELYSWGNNGNGQLGVGNLANQQTPCRVLELQNVVLSQIACGFAHSLALSDEGELFAWGSNSCGQLGVASRSNQPIPMRTAIELGRIVEIAAVHSCNITAALTQSEKVFMWGQVRGQSIGIPIETRFAATDDVFACFACPSVAWRPITFATVHRNAVQDAIRVAFDDPTTADVRISIEGRSIHAHKAILKIRCQHFRSMFRDLWPEGNGAHVEITQFPYSVYRSFLSWLYTDELDIETEDALGLLDLANCYCESALKEKCAQIIRKGITVDNSALLYAAALRFEAKDLEEYCFQFCLNHMTAVTQSESFGRLDECSVKHFVAEAAKHGAFKH
uniref:BTB domain-containing protein n=1 Tax=Plectus sambesii TaxID=2011161 RepID=A0A914WLK2_9BILA